MSNIKMAGNQVVECCPQVGLCPLNCFECWHNRNPNTEPIIPEPDDSKIIRMNSRHDSNIQKELVLATAKRYKDVFFNTSLPKFDFPGPVVWTANPNEEVGIPERRLPSNIMFVRLRTSSTNRRYIRRAIDWITAQNIPVVLTFMSYYRAFPPNSAAYDWKIRHENKYWVPKESFIKVTMTWFKNNPLVFRCGDWCKDCRNCESLYWRCRAKI